MEKWQFLIQKEGERTWHPLQKPKVEIMEGRYRVVARSHSSNTDVEVRVTHSSLSEVPPRRRIQQRRRRTSPEGLTAVIPFTYLKSGIWELQCSGDLMSDLLGASWQYTVSLVVAPYSVDQKSVSPTNSSQSVDNQHQSQEGIETQAKSKVKNAQSSLSNIKTNDAELISSISVEPVKSKSRNVGDREIISTPTSVKTSDRVASEKPADKLRESLKAASNKQKTVSKLRDSIKATAHKTTTASSVPKEKPKLPESLATQNKDVSEKPQITPKKVSEKPTQKENLAIIEQTASPARVRGDTAEQILQNLIELALPSSDLFVDETVEDTPPPLPLLLNLDQTNYIAPWGGSINIEGLVQVKETNELKQITQVEVIIELRSPQNSELLQSNRQPTDRKTLPFAIASSIKIPSISSKLILGEVKVYGASSHGAVELLACESFTITADISELLAITVADPSELARFDYSTNELSQVSNASEILEPGMSLDLELFNLVKTAKPHRSAVSIPSNKKSLPPRIEPRKTRNIVTHSLKLPSVPGYQEKIDRYINNGYIKTVSGSTITGTSFPYLRKSKALTSSDVVEVESEASVDATYVGVADNENIPQTLAQTENSSLTELVVDEQKDDNSFEFEPITPRRSEFVAAESSNTSPLIRQWMLSQGYSLPEPINVEYEDYDIEATNSKDQHTPTAKSDTPEVTQNVASRVSIQPTSSPYFSISSNSGWEISKIAIPSTQIAQEIVVDDPDIADDILDDILVTQTQTDQPIEPLKKLSALCINIGTQNIEQLPIPQLYVPQGELISGKALNVRVRLPEGSSDLAVKLWLEDCQTRHLLDGPHLLSNLTPNKNRELEVITKLNIPFGCIEIRLEAIAINTATQQESHKLTIQRTVIPPDLPNIQFDAILGM